MYAVPASKCDGSIFTIVPQTGIPVMFFVTSVQVPPPCRVSHTLPSLVPAQISPRCNGDGAIDQTSSPENCPRLSGTIPPDDTMRVGSCVERSGLITDHVWPSFDVLKMTWQP